MHMCVYHVPTQAAYVCVFMFPHRQKTRKELGAYSTLSPSSLLFPWDRSIEPRFTLVSTETKTSSFLFLFKALEKEKKSHHTWVFIWVLEIWTQVLTVAQQMFLSTESHPHTPKDGCYYYYNSFHRIPLITAEGQGSGSATQKPPSPSLSKVILQKLTYFLAMICKVSVDLNY